MAEKPRAIDFRYALGGAIALLALLVFILVVQVREKPDPRIGQRARHLELVTDMRLSLTAASEAEKNVVLAVSPDEAKRFAEQARAMEARLQQRSAELSALLSVYGTPREKDQLAQFDRSVADLRRIDDEVLELAGRNTNLRAYALAFGPAATAVGDMDQALARLIARQEHAPESQRVVLAASQARVAALWIASLLPPHIAEESDAKMTQLEERMDAEEAMVRRSLWTLRNLPRLSNDADLQQAYAAWNRFLELKATILRLSRENTNVRSLSLSLGQHRKAVAVCQDALDGLQEAVEAEPVGKKRVAPVRPR